MDINIDKATEFALAATDDAGVQAMVILMASKFLMPDLSISPKAEDAFRTIAEKKGWSASLADYFRNAVCHFHGDKKEAAAEVADAFSARLQAAPRPL